MPPQHRPGDAPWDPARNRRLIPLPKNEKLGRLKSLRRDGCWLLRKLANIRTTGGAMLFPQIEDLATTGIVSVREDAPVSTALEQMSRCKLHTIVVEEASGGFGLLTAPDLVRLRFALPSLDIAIRDVGYHRLSCIEKGKNILDVLDAFENSHGYAAVVDGSGGLCGIVSNTDILGSLDPQLMLQRQCLRDLLRRHEIKQASHDASLGEVLAHLVELDDAVIVVKAGKRVGIVTTYDAIRLLQNELALSDPVARHMSTPLHTVSVDLTVGEALATLRERHFKRLVVEDSGGNVVGDRKST